MNKMTEILATAAGAEEALRLQFLACYRDTLRELRADADPTQRFVAVIEVSPTAIQAIQGRDRR